MTKGRKSKMKAIVITKAGGAEVLELQEVSEPEAAEGHALVRISAAGINRADVMQRRGEYPPPPGWPPYPGLECSGIIESLAPDVQAAGWKIGDQVCALLGGGGYAEKVVVPVGQLLPIPRGVSLQDAAALPEVACIVWSTVFMTCHLSPGESFLVHGGSSGIGTFAIQLAKSKGARVFCTGGSHEKLQRCKQLGADVVINYKEEDFVQCVKNETKQQGANVILDIMGASYFQRNLEALSEDGRLFMIAFQGGSSGEFDLSPLMNKRLTIAAGGLRSRHPQSKAKIVEEVKHNVWPLIEAGKIRPIIYRSLPLQEAAEAHCIMESSEHIGKILLITDA